MSHASSDSGFDPLPPPHEMLRPGRKITGMSAILLPYSESGEILWPEFEAHVTRTAEAGLTPAVNMDTGYVNLLDEATRQQVLERTRGVLGGEPFVAGAFVDDAPDAAFDLAAYLRQIEPITTAGGTPVIFQSFGLTRQSDEEIIAAYEHIAAGCERFIGFELGEMFAPFGKIYSLEVYRGCWALGTASARSTLHSPASPSGNAYSFATRFAPSFLYLRATIWRLTLSCTAATTCWGFRLSPLPPSLAAMPCGRPAMPRSTN